MMDFIKTVMGRRFFEGQLPKLINNLDRIATALEKANELKEKEIPGSAQPKEEKKLKEIIEMADYLDGGGFDTDDLRWLVEEYRKK